MENSYSIVPIHQKPELFDQCSAFLDSNLEREKPFTTLRDSCDNFPTSMVLLDNENVIGHCNIVLVPDTNDCCLIQTLVISQEYRSQGLGSILLREVEQYVLKKGIRRVYLTQVGEEGFFQKHGYSACEPLDIYNFPDYKNIPSFFRHIYMLKNL